MNKLAISIAVAIALGLTGCGDSLDDIKQDAAQPGGTISPSSRVVFNPGALPVAELSVPNDLVFQGTTDGTLTLDRGDAADYTNPQVALGALDGWSTQNPFSIALSFPANVSLDMDSARTEGSVRLFKAVMGDPASPDTDCQAVPRGMACKILAELKYGEDFVSTGSGTGITVIPLKPLAAATTYLLALTSNLKDSTGAAVKPSTTYELVKQDFATKPLATESQRGLQAVINSFENTLVRDQGLNKDNIIYTAAITTQSAGVVLATLKQLMASPTPTGYAPGPLQVVDSGKTVAEVNPAFANSPAFQITRLYGGTLRLPYFLGVPSTENATAPLNTRWTARCDSGATLAALPPSMKPSTPVSENDGFCQLASGGSLRDLGVDAARHLTKFNTIPRINSYQTVDVQMTVPDSPAIQMPEAGWPVVILQHGITASKESMLAISGTLASQGFATIAIDHPLHGSRGLKIETPSGPLDFTTTPTNPTVYMNLGNLLVTRDNLRQSIFDTLALRYALNSMTGVKVDLSRVQFLGHSLGGITGTGMVSIANTPSGNAQLDAAFKIESAVLAMPGGAVANLLLESVRFGPLIKANIMLGAGGALTQDFATYIATTTDCGQPTAENARTWPGCAAPSVNDYLANLATTGNVAQQQRINATLNQFAFAAQTVIDSADPNNYAQQLSINGTPVFMISVVGDGNANLPDDTIPNGFFNPLAALAQGKMPLAGTEPLARLLGTITVPAEAPAFDLTGNAITRFNAGGHASLLSPVASSEATTEMQFQTATFFLSRGKRIGIKDTSVIAAN